jgi:CRISPR-associated endonuclease Csn1
MAKMKYRLALDLGTNSIGWALIRLADSPSGILEPSAIIRTGVRIFGDGKDPKSGSSLAVDRRLARGARRNRDRKLKRKQRLMLDLIDCGFMPADKAERGALVDLDPYLLRAQGLNAELSPYKFGRAIFHLNQRRGFKSNRKTDTQDSDSSLMKNTINQVQQMLESEGYVTVGEWLAQRHEKRESVRARLRGSGVKEKMYDLYFDRAMIETEFNALWSTQAAFNPAFFTPKKREMLHETLFFQRNLLPVRPGRCTFEPDQERAAKALPSSQLFRIYQEVNNLGIEDGNFTFRPLTLIERDAIVEKLCSQKTVSFDAMRRLLKLAGAPRFNLESGKRKDLKGNSTAFSLCKAEMFGTAWDNLTLGEQDEVTSEILDVDDDDKLVSWLMESFGLTDEAALTVSQSRNEITKQATGYANLSSTAICKILPHLKSDVRKYSDAVIAAGYKSHSGLTHVEQTGEILDRLPYYGEYLQRHVGHGSGVVTDDPSIRFGRIANPTVHIALNEVAKVVNRLLVSYGSPDQVIVEVTRDLKRTKEQKDEESKKQAENQKANERWSQEILEATGITATRKDLQKMKLWAELNPKDPTNRCCIYTGEVISITRLFSPEVEIEHILPFSRTLDDSLNNKTVSMVKANRYKGNQTPFEAFGSSPEGYIYDDILVRARNSNRYRAARFGPEGYAHWLKNDADFLARALNDTAYLSLIAREYLQLITPTPVVAVPGRMTASLRRHWGLNNLLSEDGEKNRSDHRHHAVDAVVIGLMDRGSLQRYARESGRGASMSEQLVKTPHEPPLNDLREKAGAAIRAIKVSHRPNHSFERQMNNDTNYGFRPNGFVATRKALDEFATLKALTDLHFADSYLKEKILRFVGECPDTGLKSRLADFTDETGTRKITYWQKLDVIPIPLNPAVPERAPKGMKARADNSPRGVKGDSNYCLEIYVNDKGKWVGEVVSSYGAYRIARTQSPTRLRDPYLTQSGKPLVIRLMRDDVVQVDVCSVDDRQLMRVCKFASSGAISLSPISEANVDARVRAKEISYLSASAGTLQQRSAKKVTITPDGRVSLRNLS